MLPNSVYMLPYMLQMHVGVSVSLATKPTEQACAIAFRVANSKAVCNLYRIALKCSVMINPPCACVKQVTVVILCVYHGITVQRRTSTRSRRGL